MLSVQDALSKMGPQHIATLEELYCQPHRQNLRISGTDMSKEMEELGVYKIPTVTGRHPMTDFGFRVVHELIKQGKWPV